MESNVVININHNTVAEAFIDLKTTSGFLILP